MSRPRILIVDDEADIRSSLKMILEYEEMEPIRGLRRVWRRSPSAAEQAPDAVLLDIKMQGMDGLEVLAKLRANHPELPVVMVSGHGTIATAVEATRLGAFDFMEKPLERDRVLLVLRNALERKRLQDQKSASTGSTLKNATSMVGASKALEAIHQGGRARRADPGFRADHGRIRDRQGNWSPGRFTATARAPARSVRQGQLRGDPRRVDRVRVVRPRQGLVHRRDARTRSASSSVPTAERSSSTRSAI